jgi:putative two-component system response regulator
MVNDKTPVLIVDDDRVMHTILKKMLEPLGYAPIATRSGAEALELLKRGDVHLVITDWEMPVMDGLELCRAIRSEDLPGYVYVIMLTGREGAQSRIEGLDAGADDFLNKPLNAGELMVCLKTAHRILGLETRDVALFALAKLAESRDQETGDHIERVQNYTRVLVRHLAPDVKTRHGIDEQFIRLIYQTSPLHDLGKVAIPDAILLKPGKLTPAEYEIMKAHAELGAQTLDAALRRFPQARFLQMARDIAATHHEKFDGSGYPSGLSGEQIPLCGRIVALADVYDALTSRRVYKEAMSHEQAKSIILHNRGKHFDPDVVDAFLAAESLLVEVHKRFNREDPVWPATLLAANAANAGGEELGEGYKILVVEDDPFMRKQLLALLARTGCTVLCATNVDEARRMVAEESPKLVISDWEMPGEDGLDFCKHLRRQQTLSSVHFIMLTVHSDQQLLLNAYKAGVDDFVSKPFNADELLARVQAGLRRATLHGELLKKTNDLRSINMQLASMNARLDRLAVTDELTGLYNRRHAMFKLEEHWELSRRTGEPLSVIIADVDYFKRINDTHGHGVGDMMLHRLATLLREQAGNSDTVCRIGGEEFLIILPGHTIEQAHAFAERCRAEIERRASVTRDRAVQATISAGVAARVPAMLQFSELLRAADQALYAAKRAGRNRVHSGDAAPAPPPLPIDIQRVREKCGGDQSFAAAVIQRFCQQAGHEVERIAESLAAGQLDALQRRAQNLRSMTAYLSADQASDLSRRIEQLARDRRADEIGALTDQLRHEIAGVVDWITQNVEAMAAG